MPRTALLRPLVLALALAVGAPAFAQDVSIGFNPRTGDVWVDTWLDDVNRYGRAYREPFVDELVRYHGAPRDLVVELLSRPGWTPGDVYYACRLATVLGRPCRFVADEYERDRGEGWGALAKRLGIKPGSAEFHRLKRGFVPTYDRWSRPIRLDADLERAFPGRAKGKSGGRDAPGRPDRSDGPGRPDKGGKPAKPDGGQGARDEGPRGGPDAGKHAGDHGPKGGGKDKGGKGGGEKGGKGGKG